MSANTQQTRFLSTLQVHEKKPRFIAGAFSGSHVGSGEPIKLALGDSEAVVNPTPPIRPTRELESPQELPLYPATHRIARYATHCSHFLDRQPLLIGIHTCLQT